jgi:hypothetical protein
MNFNNMNRYGTGTGAAKGTFGAAKGTFGGDCDRNKLGLLLAANIAALLNKKGESESESKKSENQSPQSQPPIINAQELAQLQELEERQIAARIREEGVQKLILVQTQLDNLARLLDIPGDKGIPFDATADEIIVAVRLLARELDVPIPGEGEEEGEEY